jgi:ParE toxin of type II toxin-antitoxin system, parDE
MAMYRLSRLAEADLIDIGTYTLHTWGEDQTIRYLDDLEACCQRLADSQELGRACDHIRLAPHGTRTACCVLPNCGRGYSGISHPSPAYAAGTTEQRGRILVAP